MSWINYKYLYSVTDLSDGVELVGDSDLDTAEEATRRGREFQVELGGINRASLSVMKYPETTFNLAQEILYVDQLGEGAAEGYEHLLDIVASIRLNADPRQKVPFAVRRQHAPVPSRV